MKNPSYLLLSRHNIYYFRWPLPRQIQAKGKTIHIKLSLDTRDPKEALRLSTMLQEYGYNLLRQDWVLGMDYAEIKAMVEAHFSKRLDEYKRDIDRDGPLTPSHKSFFNAAITHAQSDKMWEGGQTLNGAFGLDDDPEIAGVVMDYQLDLSNDEKDKQRLKALCRYAVIAVMQEVLAYNDRQEKFDFSTAGATNAISYRPLKPENRLDKVTDAFIAEMMKSKAWGIRAEEERKDCLNLLKELVGENTDINQIDIPKARYVKETLSRLPANRNKLEATRDLPLLDQIKVPGLKTLSVGSINKYLQVYGSLFKWAISNGYTDSNPFAGMALKDKGKKKRGNFKPEQVTRIFAEISKGKAGLVNNDTRYWGLLIGLYTGARLNEIASLTPNDVKHDKKSGIWYFDINDEEETKSLKSDAAKRHVPIHSRLIELGLLKYVDGMRQRGETALRLLPDLTYSEKEGWGRKLNRWFNDTLLPNMELKQDNISFHSLRHTVITNLRSAGVDNHNVRALVGHEPDGVTEEVYNHGIDLSQLQKDIERLSYAG